MNAACCRTEIRRGDQDYPACLEDLRDPPKVLYVCGDPGQLRTGLAVIGHDTPHSTE